MEDLSEVLTGLMTNARPTSIEGKQKLANDPLTIELLEAGVRLIERELGGDDPLLARWLSYQFVTREVNRRWHKTITESARRYRWPDHRDYIKDVVAYSLMKGYQAHYLTGTGPEREALLVNEDFARAVHDAAYADVVSAASLKSTRVQLIVTALGEETPPAAEALQDMYASVDKTWGTVYKELLDGMGLKFRAGLTIEDFTHALTAMSEGLQMRILADPNTKVVDHEAKTSLLGSVALALFISWIDHFEDGKTLEEVAKG